MTRPSSDRKRIVPALDATALERLALHYAGRYATTRAKLATYLDRKLRERGWAGDDAPDIGRIVTRFAELGYVDDRAFAEARAAGLQRRGYGARRVGQALRAAGISDEDRAPLQESLREGEWAAAMAFARRRRIGPFARDGLDRDARQRAAAAMMRAGHDPAHVRRIVAAAPGDETLEE